MFSELWRAAPATVQDLAILIAIVAPAVLLGLAIRRGFALRALLSGMMRRHFWTHVVFVLLVAASVGLGVGLIAQERGLREASARAADKFDVVLAAPGDEVAMLLATVFLQPTDAPLLTGELFAEVSASERLRFAAPLGFGDSHRGAPVVGATARLVAHLSGGTLAEGRSWETPFEAVIGARSPLAIGDVFTPAHGHGALAEANAHAGIEIEVVGRMNPTGGPWDRAIVTPIEGVWLAHGLSDGHDPADDAKEGADRLGPPYDPEWFPGAPAIVLVVDDLAAAYGLQARYATDQVMAFFPGAVLSRLHALLGDVRSAMSVLALATQLLVAIAVIAGLIVLARLAARRLALLRAIGAPARMVFALVWSYAASLLGVGGVLGLAVGWIATRVLSAAVAARTDLAIAPGLSWPELHLAAAFVALCSIAALLPAALALARPVVDDLRP